MGLLRDFYIAIAIVISLLLLTLSIFSGLKVGYYETSRWCSMSWSRPQYEEITELTNVRPLDVRSLYPSSYKMYRHYQATHKFVQNNAAFRKDKDYGDDESDIDTIIIFIPGQSGSYLQIRSIASRILHDKYLLLLQDINENNNNHHNNILFLTFNFGNEWSSISSSIITRQTAFVYMMLNEYLCHNKSLITDKTSKKYKDDVDIIFIGHSMGGIVTSSLINILSRKPIQTKRFNPIDQYNHNLLSRIKGVIFVSTPSFKPVIKFENTFKKFHKFHSMKFAQVIKQNDIKLLTISGGLEDFLIESYLSQIPNGTLNKNIDFVVSDLCPSIMNTMDHQATIWCHGITETVARYILGILNDEKDRNNHLYPYVPKLKNIINTKKQHIDDDEFTLNQTFKTRMDLQNIKDSTIVVSCSYPLKYLELCDKNNKNKCVDITKHFKTVPSWISHPNNTFFNSSLNHEGHAFLQKFIAVINAEDIAKSSSLDGKYLNVKGTTYNSRDICSLWQGYIHNIDHAEDNKIEKSQWDNIEGFNHYNNFNLKTNGVYVDKLRLSPLMYHDIKIRITPPYKPLPFLTQKTRNDHLCVSGWSGMIIPSGNGVYYNSTVLNTEDVEHFYTQEQSFWYSPRIKMNKYQDGSSRPLYLFKHSREDMLMWSFGTKLGNWNVNAFCDKYVSSVETTKIPQQCRSWGLLEFNLNDQGEDGWRDWRSKVLLSISDQCSPYDVSLLHLTTRSSHLYNEWVSLSTIHKQSIHRTIIPRLNDELLVDEHMDNALIFEWYLFDKINKENENKWTIDIEYNYLSSLINTIIRDFQYFPFVLIMSIWFGMMAEMYRLRGVDLINFYLVTQTVLMIVSCLDLLPLNDHWKYVYLCYQKNEINSNNFKLYLLEFILPYIYFSSCIILIYSIQLILNLIIRKIIFAFIKFIHMNDLFVIPWFILEYTVYAAIILYSLCNLISPDLGMNLKRHLLLKNNQNVDDDIDMEIHYIIIGILGVIPIWNLVRKIAINNNLFGFYEVLLCISLLFTRWDILFGILEKQQHFELIIMSICFLIISHFDICSNNNLSKYSSNFHAKALLSLSNQIYIMQRNLHSSILGQKFVLTPLLQAVICWTISKIIIKKFL